MPKRRWFPGKVRGTARKRFRKVARSDQSQEAALASNVTRQKAGWFFCRLVPQPRRKSCKVVPPPRLEDRMKLSIKAELVYTFAEATQIIANIEASHTSDQTILSESLDVQPSASVRRSKFRKLPLSSQAAPNEFSTLQPDLCLSNQGCSLKIDSSRPSFLSCLHRSRHPRIHTLFPETARMNWSHRVSRSLPWWQSSPGLLRVS